MTNQQIAEQNAKRQRAQEENAWRDAETPIKTNRALVMKEHFTADERDLIHYALEQYAKTMQKDFPGYSITMSTLELKEIFARQ